MRIVSCNDGSIRLRHAVTPFHLLTLGPMAMHQIRSTSLAQRMTTGKTADEVGRCRPRLRCCDPAARVSVLETGFHRLGLLAVTVPPVPADPAVARQRGILTDAGIDPDQPVRAGRGTSSSMRWTLPQGACSFVGKGHGLPRPGRKSAIRRTGSRRGENALIFHQHHVQPPRTVRAEFQGLLDIR